VKHSIDTGEPGEAEFRVVWPDGSTHWLTGRWQVFKDETGSPLCLTGVNIDVTADKKAEAALRESEARFHAIADAAPVLIWISGPDKQCSYVNKGWLDFTGRTIEQELGNGWTEGVYSGDFDLCLKTYVEAFDKQGPFEMEFRLRRFDGQYRWILDRGIPRLGPDGTFLGYIGTCIDITELKQAKEAVQESEERLGGIISSAMDAIITIDEMQRVTDFNNAAELMFGCAAAAALGQPIDHFIPERFRAKHTHHIRAFGDTQVTKRQMGALGTIYGRRADGNEFPIEASISQLRTHAGKFYTVILRDITDRVRHEEVLQERDHTLTTVNEALKKQAVALAEANKELEGFSYSVSHDLRAPLRTIDAFSRIVEEDHGPRLNDEGRRSLSIVRKAVGQAGELIDDLLEFSKLGRQGMSFRVVKMADLARETAENLRIMREGRQVELTIGDLPACQGDRRFLKLVWMNLLTNAFKYTKNRKEAKIEVGWMPDDASADSVIYYVKDNGIGFNMAYAHKMFGVFQRLHPREDFDGTGVGLAVVQRIVQRHDGRVWAEGKVDEGATFFFSLRKAPA
jgi:PAS domain S-box-containing protein